MPHFLRTTASALAVAAGLALTVSACGGESDQDGSSQVSSSGHNEADVTFATDMIQQHAQALAMVDLMRGRTVSADLHSLADQIQAAQGPGDRNHGGLADRLGRGHSAYRA